MTREERLEALLADISDALQPYVDVSDGDDGPRPNWAMSLVSQISEELDGPAY